MDRCLRSSFPLEGATKVLSRIRASSVARQLRLIVAAGPLLKWLISATAVVLTGDGGRPCRNAAHRLGESVTRGLYQSGQAR